MSTAVTSFIAIVIATAALTLGLIAIVISGDGGCGNACNSSTPLGSFQTPVFLSLRDNRTQLLTLGGDIWTAVRFNTNTMITNAWTHTTAADSIVQANRAGLYVVYFSIQAQLSNSLSISPACKPCNLIYHMRAVQERIGIIGRFEVPGSMTYASGQSYFLSKQFHINATVGDIFRFQFMSSCETLSLQPLSNVGGSMPSGDSFPVSATLLIF